MDIPTIAEFTEMSFWGNTGEKYLIAAGIVLVLLILLKLVKIVVILRLKTLAKKTKTDVDDLVIEIIDSFQWPFLSYLSFYAATKYLVFSAEVDKVFDTMMIVFVVLYIAKALNKIVEYIARKEIQKRSTNGEQNTSLINVIAKIVQVTVWVIAFLLLLSNLGVNITSLVAGLGVGGIAIAFSLQRILEDIFSSFSIYFDKPFEEGDFIVIGEDLGTVKHIGLKTTRIQHLQGQELVVSNRELTSARINNYKKMEKRRIAFKFGVEYSTPVKKLKKINGMIKEILGKIKTVQLDMVHFKEFGDFALIYEVVYYINSGDYLVYMEAQQQINLEIKEQFEKEKIKFALPSQTIYLKK